MASGGARRSPAAGADLRERLETWLAAGVTLAFVVADLARRALAGLGRGLREVPSGLAWLERRTVPALSHTGRALMTAVGWTVDAIARGTTTLMRQAPPLLGAAESRVVPALASSARAVALACGWVVERAAGLYDPAKRNVAVATGRTTQATAVLAAAAGRRSAAVALATGRWLDPHLPRVGSFVARASLWGLGAVTVVGLAAHPTLQLAAAAVSLDEDAPDQAGFPPLDERSTVYAADGSTLALLHGEVDRRVLALDQIPLHVQQAVLAAEDRQFYDHGGYDVESIARAAMANFRAKAVVQGGSTITQQLAKQNYVGNARVLTRKANELVHAVALEQEFSKDELLERYLNQVYFGSGAYGVAVAAEQFFGVPTEQLTVEQAALLAGLIHAPNTLDPRDNPEGAQQRRNEVLAAMAEGGFLTAEEARTARERPLQVAEPHEREQREPHVVAAIKRAFLNNPTFGETREERARLLFAGGLQIHTTIHPGLQGAAAATVQAFVDPEHGPAAAMAVVEPVTGRVRALHSGVDFGAEQYNLATQGRRQPGSAFKPFVFAAALEQGAPVLQDLRGDAEVTFDVGPEPWQVHNYENEGFGTIDGHEALVDSVNTAFADLIVRMGVEPVVDVANRLGIDVEDALGPASSRGPSIALGGLTHGVSPLEMASAYGTFANQGIAVEPYLIERVVDADGNELLARQPAARRALDEDVNAQLVDALQDVVEEGTGGRARLLGWEPIGKTGTTQDSADAWFVGAVPGLSTAVWVGHPDGRTPIHGLTGGSLPAPIWRAFMLRALEGAEPVAFPESVAEEPALSVSG